MSIKELIKNDIGVTDEEAELLADEFEEEEGDYDGSVQQAEDELREDYFKHHPRI
jgi:hypothetical protein